MTGKLFIVSAPSCAGKTSLLQAVLAGKAGESVSQYITYTTKPPRKGDIHGKDFHFISVDEFKRKIKEGFFLEWSNTYINYYGTPRSIMNDLEAGISYIIILDRAGARQMMSAIPEAVLIWIFVSELDELAGRLCKRGLDTPEQVQLRLQLAEREMKEEKSEKIYHYHIKNDDFDAALAYLEQIIFSYVY